MNTVELFEMTYGINFAVLLILFGIIGYMSYIKDDSQRWLKLSGILRLFLCMYVLYMFWLLIVASPILAKERESINGQYMPTRPDSQWFGTVDVVYRWEFVNNELKIKILYYYFNFSEKEMEGLAKNYSAMSVGNRIKMIDERKLKY